MRLINRLYTIFILCLILVTLLQCDANKVVSKNPLWVKYIKGHTSGIVSRKSNINIHFLNDVIDKKSVGTSAEEYLDITPKLEGTKEFISTKEIVIIPKDALRQGKKYFVKVKVSEFIDIPEELDSYKFSFDVIKQQYEANILELETDENSNSMMNLRGSIITADIEDSSKIEKMLSYSKLNNNIAINWNHKDNNHEFIIKGIKRQSKARMLTLSWTGSPINVSKSVQKEVSIPAKDIFSIIDAKVVQGAQRYIALYFSDNIDKRQNLKGFIRIRDKKFTTDIVKNTIRIYLAKNNGGNVYLTAEPGIKNVNGFSIKKRYNKTLYFHNRKPGVRFIGKGVILPRNKALSIPFEAINIKSVQVTAFLVYENNMGYFLQTNKLDGSASMSRVGRYLWRKTIYLPFIKGDTWSRYYLDATELFSKHKEGLFRLSISINRGNSIYSCSKEDNKVPIVKESPIKNAEDLHLTEVSSWDYAEDYYNQDNYSSRWVDRKNPCKDAYFRYNKDAKDSKNFLASNIGIIAKMGSNKKVHIVTTEIDTSSPLSGVNISIMNFQNQLMAKVTTDDMGFAEADISSRPFYSVAEKDGQKGYLKMTRGTALPISHFEVAGEAIKAGIKGFIYGERGVWRPGDNIYLTFVLQDKKGTLPMGYPVTMRFFDPRGRLVKTITNGTPVDRFYSFNFKTDANAPTGNWTAKANIGINIFTKKVKVETIVPNRLKVLLDLGKDIIYRSDMPISVNVFGQWLHGAKASNLKADVSLSFRSIATKFSIFTDYSFDDPVREFTGESRTIFEGRLNDSGNVSFKKDITPESKPPGNLSAYFRTRIFENSGAFSVSGRSFTYYPYKSYVGIRLPKGDQKRNMLLTDKLHRVSIVSINDKGKRISLRGIKVSLYKIRWRWWWNKSKESLARFISSSSTTLVKEGNISTRNGRGSWNFKIKYPSWGRYLIRACGSGGHCTGKVFYIDWPGWAGKAREQMGVGASILNFSSNKAKYQVGDTAVIKLPKLSQGRVFMTAENASGVLSKRWVDINGDNTKFSIKITKEMLPNFYVSVSLIQPHKGKRNDRPIRLYGVIPIKVYDPGTKLKPIINTSKVWEAESKVSIGVSEARGREMVYTLAIVDEGLLGITSFKTPRLHKAFYKKEALGVSSWDIYDSVIGAYGGALERLLSIGGDGVAKFKRLASDPSRARFIPVVKYLGAFRLKSGEKKTHKVVLPQYIGALRVMVVAGKRGAYGSTDRLVVVKKALAILSTIPRVIGPSEELTVPVNLFVGEDSIKNVTLDVKVNNYFSIIGNSSVRLRFDKPGEKMAFIKLRVKDKLGKGKVVFTARSRGYNSESTTYIDVRSPNPATIRQVKMEIAPNDVWEQDITPHGIVGTNEVFLETSIVPPLNLERRVDFLVRYPHGCVEQVTSALFPQIFLSSLVNIGGGKQKEIENNIGIGIERLQKFQVDNGGFLYWPGGFLGGGVNDWVTSYVGHFLLEAERLGYYVPKEMVTRWISYQRASAKRWYKRGNSSVMVQGYRLYTLALAGKADIGAMNRLKGLTKVGSVDRYLLASAYYLAGLPDVARGLAIEVPQYIIADYKIPGRTLGSRIRDRAIILNALVTMKDNKRAKVLADEISRSLVSGKWYSTHTTSYSLLAMSKFVASGRDKNALSFEKAIGDGSLDKVSSSKPIHSIRLSNFPDGGQVVKVKNTSSKVIYATITVRGMPKAGEETYTSLGLRVYVDYLDSNGNSINVNRIKQGTDFTAKVTVTNTSDSSLKDIALTHIIPSGWQIGNRRLGIRGLKVDYQDIRDDRVYSYFSLKLGKSKVIPIKLNASFLGRYYLPSISAELMYDASIGTRIVGRWVEVIK